MENKKEDVSLQILDSSEEVHSTNDTPRQRVSSPVSNQKLFSTDSKSQTKSITATTSPPATSSQPHTSALLHHKMSKLLILVELIAFVLIIVFLIASLKTDRLKNSMTWDLKLWKWSLLLLAIFCGRLIATIFVDGLISLIWKNWLNEKVLYFVYGVKKSVQVFIWLGLISLAWILLFDIGLDNIPEERKETVRSITKGLVGCVVGAAIWLVKTLLVRLIGSFHATKMFEKIKEAVIHRKIVLALSNPKKKKMVVDKECEIMEELIGGIRCKELRGLTYMVHGQDNGEPRNGEINDESAARDASDKIFENLRPDGQSDYMEMETLGTILPKDPDDDNYKKVIQHFEEGRDEKGITKSFFKEWVVKVYNDHKSLNDTLRYRKTAMDELNMLLSGIVLVIDIIAFLFFMGLLTMKLLLLISSQLVLAAFMFGNAARTIFEAIIFVFLMHPFDVGDRCVIDGVQMVVEEMSILKTIFLRYDGEKIYYPNSVLAGKPISNLYRSPPMMDCLEFAIDLSTPKEILLCLQDDIKKYIESHSKLWRPAHSVQFKEIENVNKMKMVLFVNHTINFHYVQKRCSRRSDLVLQMKEFFEDLGIQYHLLPQQVQINYVPPTSWAFPPPAR